MQSEAEAPARKYPQLQWQLPEVTPVLGSDLQLGSALPYTRPASASLQRGHPSSLGWPASQTQSQPGSFGQAGKPAPARRRPQTSGAVPSDSKAAATMRQQQPWSDTGDSSEGPQKPVGKTAKLEWAVPAHTAKPGGQKTAGLLIPSAGQGKTLAQVNPQRAGAESAKAAETCPPSASDNKWSRLQALKLQRSAHARAVLEAGRISPATSTSSPERVQSPQRLAALANPSPRATNKLGASVSAAAQLKAAGKTSKSQRAAESSAPPCSSAAELAQLDRFVQAAEAAPSSDGQALVTCSGCERSFNPSAYERHARVCAKVFQSKRKVFDMTAARAPEAASGGLFGDAPGPRRRSSGGAPSRAKKAGAGRDAAVGAAAGRGAAPKWKAQSAQLRAAMAAARGADSRPGGAPVAPSEPDMSLVPCPHCGRRFNDQAAERHIPKCRDIFAKPSRLKAGAGRGAYARR